MEPTLKPPGTKRLKLKCDVLLSTFAFKSNLRRYTEEDAVAEEEARVKDLPPTPPRARRFPPNMAVAAVSETIIPTPVPAPAPAPPLRAVGEGGGDALAAIIGGRQGLPLVHFSPPPETFLLLIPRMPTDTFHYIPRAELTMN
jgi:hypothetical protein